jgi:hypothetical protein
MSNTTSAIVSLATSLLGIGDTPASTNFSFNCNPFTYFENSSASATNCGTDPHFNVQDHSEAWCADFTKYVWDQSNVSGPLSDLTPGAASLYAYGHDEGESMPLDPPVSNAQVGDAIVLYPPSVTASQLASSTPGSVYADHVGIITAVNADGTIDTVNGDMPWSSPYIEVSTSGNMTPQAYATAAEGPSGEQWIFVAPAGSTTPPLANTYLAEMQDNASKLYGYNYGTNVGTTLGMNPGSSPSTIGLSDDSTYVTAFQDNANALYLHYSTGTNVNTGLGMDPGTSPAVAALATGNQWEAAFQANNHFLYLRSASTDKPTTLGMDPASSPAITGSGGGWITAFQDNNHYLYITTSAGLEYETTLGMAPGTSPSISALARGGFIVAFQANNSKLYIFSTSGAGATDIANGVKHPTDYGMEAGTSPSIASYTDSTWRAAFQTNDHDLYTYSSAGSDNPSGMQMDTASSPAITCLPDGTYEVAFEANNNGLDIYHTGGTNNATGLGMLAGTSPTISSPYNP